MPATSASKNKNVPLRLFSEAKNLVGYKATNGIIENALPLFHSYYIYMFLNVSAQIAQMFVLEICPSPWCHYTILYP